VVAATNNNFSFEPLQWLAGWGTGTSITRSTYEFTFGGATGPFSTSSLLSSPGPLQNPTFTNSTPVEVTLQAKQPYGNLGYSRVRVEVDVIPPQGGTLQLWAKDTSGNWWNIVATGWGDPSTGFTIGPDYSVTTPVYVVADQAGDYTIKVKLIDLNNSNRPVITQTTQTIEVR
jgi:hypothetical protein